MRLRFLGSTSEAGACPSLYETDRGTIVVQGLEVVDGSARADLLHVLDGLGWVAVLRCGWHRAQGLRSDGYDHRRPARHLPCRLRFQSR